MIGALRVNASQTCRTRQTADNILLVYFSNACLISRLIVFFFHQTRHAFRYKFISTLGIGMLGTICVVEIFMMRKKFSFRSKDQYYTCINKFLDYDYT